MLHVKLTVNYTVSFTCNIHFFNLTYFIFAISLRVTNLRVSLLLGINVQLIDALMQANHL